MTYEYFKTGVTVVDGQTIVTETLKLDDIVYYIKTVGNPFDKRLYYSLIWANGLLLRKHHGQHTIVELKYPCAHDPEDCSLCLWGREDTPDDWNRWRRHADEELTKFNTTWNPDDEFWNIEEN